MAALPVLSISVAAQDPPAQTQASALMRGYRAGYSDGYPAGVRDATNQADKDFHSKPAYQQADRAYSPNFGSLDEYRNGYKQGFEVGYGDGFDRRDFDSSIPNDLKVRESNDDSQAPVMTSTSRPPDNTSRPPEPRSNVPDNSTNTTDNAGTPTVLTIPHDTVMPAIGAQAGTCTGRIKFTSRLNPQPIAIPSSPPEPVREIASIKN